MKRVKFEVRDEGNEEIQVKQRGSELTRVDVDGTYELKRNSFTHKLVKTIEEGGTEIVEVQHILLHQHHRSFHPVPEFVFAGEDFHDILKHYAESNSKTNTKKQ